MKKIIYILFIGALIPLAGNVYAATSSASGKIKEVRTELKTELKDIRTKEKETVKTIRELASSTIAQKRIIANEKISAIKASSTAEKIETVGARVIKINEQLVNENKKAVEGFNKSIEKFQKNISELENKLKTYTGSAEDIASVRSGIILEKNAIDLAKAGVAEQVNKKYVISVSATTTLLKSVDKEAQAARKVMDTDIKKVKNLILEIERAEKNAKVDFSKLTKPKKITTSTSSGAR